MGSACFLCVIGMRSPSGSGFAGNKSVGTCRKCSVHACSEHGERGQYFYCADCLAVRAARSAVRGDVGSREAMEAKASAPRLALASAWTRRNLDPERMSVAIAWLRDRMESGGPLVEHDDRTSPSAGNAPDALAIENESLDSEEAAVLAELKSVVAEREARSEVDIGAEELPFAGRRSTQGASRLAIDGLGIAYSARRVEDAATSPYLIHGGLTMPGLLIVLGHAYSRADRLLG
jgi:hypothetical protein